jgi:ABC-type lipoprotein export system ATPase subunit
METLRRLNREDDVTIVQVTHSEKQASYGDRIIELVDGQIEDDYSLQTEAPVQG